MFTVRRIASAERVLKAVVQMSEKSKELLVTMPTEDDLVSEKVERVRGDSWALSSEVNREWSTYLLDGGADLAEMGKTGAMWAGGSALTVGGTTALVVSMSDPFFAVLPFLWHFVMPMLLMCGGGMAAFWWLAKFFHKHATERALKRVADREDERLSKKSVYYREIAEKMPERVKAKYQDLRVKPRAILAGVENELKKNREALRVSKTTEFYSGQNRQTESTQANILAEQKRLLAEVKRLDDLFHDIDAHEAAELAKIANFAPLATVVASREHRDANNPEETIIRTNAELEILSELDDQIDELMMLAHLDAGMPIDDATALMDGGKPELPASTEDKPILISDDED